MPAKDHEFRMEVDSDSDISLLGDAPSRSKAKGKGKASDKPKKDKGKGKAKDTVSSPFHHGTSLFSFLVVNSKRILGRLRIHALGILYKRMRVGACKVRWRIGWLGVDVAGQTVHYLRNLLELISPSSDC